MAEWILCTVRIHTAAFTPHGLLVHRIYSKISYVETSTQKYYNTSKQRESQGAWIHGRDVGTGSYLKYMLNTVI